MFFKLLRYDLKNGFLSTYKRYMVSIVAFCLMFVHFMVSVYNHNMGAKRKSRWRALWKRAAFLPGRDAEVSSRRTGRF